MIAIGTSGFDYDDWRGVFYPDDLPKSQFLEYYAQFFEALELNFSYYRMPEASQLERMLKRTEGKLRFALKAHRSMTHERVAGKTDVRAFVESLAPLRSANVLSAVLLQFPHSFHLSEENRRHVYTLREAIGVPLVAEFRSAEWATPPVFDWLRSIDTGYCCVDEPHLDGLMPRIALSTSSPAYVRFHGRNAQKWYTHDQPAERYDYLYSPKELMEWVPLIERLDKSADRTLVFFNNHFQAKAVNNARTLSHLLHLEVPLLQLKLNRS